MSVLADFFKGADTQLGIFAPRGHLVALFPNFLPRKRPHEICSTPVFLKTR